MCRKPRIIPVFQQVATHPRRYTRPMSIAGGSIDYAALEATRLDPEPFDHLVVADLIKPDALRAINEDYPDIAHAGNLSTDDLAYGDDFATFLAEVTGPEFAAAVGRKFAIDLRRCPTTVTVRKFCESSDGNIHADHKSKVITALFSFNEHWEGTSGQLRLLRSAGNIEDYAAEVTPIGGTFLAFRRTDHSFHGHKRFVGERRTMQVNFLRGDTLSLLRHKVDRLGTRLIKKALRAVGR